MQDIYQMLATIQAQRQPLNIFTGKAAYQSMLIASLGVTTNESSEYAVQAIMVCREVIIVTTQTLQPGQAAQAVPQSTSVVTNQGNVTAQQVAPGGSQPAFQSLTGWRRRAWPMSTFYQIPLVASPQTFSITLAGVTYTMTLMFHSAYGAVVGAPVGVDQTVPTAIIDTNDLDGWALDIGDASNSPIVCGIPLIPGIDLFYQYRYLGFGGSLVAAVDGDPDAVPDFAGLGTTGALYFVTDP